METLKFIAFIVAMPAAYVLLVAFIDRMGGK